MFKYYTFKSEELEKPKTVIVTQARIGSTRLPGKILKKIGDKSLLKIHLERLKKVKNIEDIFIATTHEKEIEKIISIAKNSNIKYYQGSTNDVLDRYYNTLINNPPEFLVRVTSDCPLIDPILIENIIDFAIDNNVDYCSNVLNEIFPDGQDIEVIKWSALKYTWENAKSQKDREHVTSYIRNNCTYNGKKLFSSISYEGNFNYNNIRMTVDELSDFKAVETLINSIGEDKSWLEYTNYIIGNKDKFSNQLIIRNEGF